MLVSSKDRVVVRYIDCSNSIGVISKRRGSEVVLDLRSRERKKYSSCDQCLTATRTCGELTAARGATMRMIVQLKSTQEKVKS